MGMSCTIRALTEQQIDVLLANPDRVWDVAYWHADEPEEYEDEDETIETLFGGPLIDELDLDKSWSILRFLLLAEAGYSFSGGDDASSELLWGELIGDEPADYGGPGLRNIDETRQFADFLRPLTPDQLLSHFKWQEMRKVHVYLIWDEVPGESEERDLREYAAENFAALREYVLNAAASGRGLLYWVN